MKIHELIRELREPAQSKIVLLVADGLGGLPLEPGGKTELETASTPNLDAAVRDGVCGLSTPVLPGITPGSGPGHLGLFGYDPLEYRIGRGILEALGINFEVGPKDVAIRGNFCTARRRGHDHRSPGRPAHATRRTPPPSPSCAPSRCPASNCSSSRSASIASSSSFAATAWATPSTTPIRKPSACRRSTAEGPDAASQKTADAVNHFVAEAGEGAQGSRGRPTA